jgi:hypothetical protein
MRTRAAYSTYPSIEMSLRSPPKYRAYYRYPLSGAVRPPARWNHENVRTSRLRGRP